MKRLILIFLCLVSFSALAADKDSTAFVHRIGINVRPGYLSQQHEFFRGANALGRPMRATASAHLQYSFSFPSTSLLGRLYPTAYQGVGVASNTFGNHAEIGTPTAVYLFQGAQIADFGHGLSLDYEWNFGVSMGWKPFEEAGPDGAGGNPANHVVGTKVNAYLNAGLMLSWHPSPRWSLSAGIDMSHFSNGDTTFPNSGVNTIGARLGVTHSFCAGESSLGNRHYGRKRPAIWFVDRWTCDVLAYGAWNEEQVEYHDREYRADGKFAVAGIHVNPLCNLWFPYLSVGAAVDIQYNESMNIQNHIAGFNPVTDEVRFYRPPFWEQFAVGLSLRAELQMPIFAINIGLGHNILYKGEELGGLYSLLSLKTFVTDKLFMNVGLKVSDKNCSNNLMLGLGWRFGN